MELRHLEHFVAVAEEQHFTHAAERLRVAQSGVSASVRALERELGAELFLRTTRRVGLTDAGRALLVEARRTLACAAAAREAVAAVQGLMGGKLSVGTEQCMGTVDAAALLAAFHSRHPQVEIHMEQAGSGRLLEQVRRGELDVAFVVHDGSHEGVRLRGVAAEPLMLLCRADHPLAGVGGPVPPAQLGGEVFVDLHPDWGARRAADLAFADAGVARKVALQVNDVYTLLDLVSRGLGAAVVPRPVTFKEQARGLSSVPLDSPTSWQVAVAVPAAGQPTAAARALLAMLEERGPAAVPTE
ncbi:LysR family transcriptional regulator [Streptomyces eurocidicus]|uniref:DNA-binding transcriptional LysR family regulator n=1 Tax=Streptomyces eurocidicus TaxID=66423 RepID=A0A2N8NQ00_STREU|nr:LysR family transcriptional regulator [Streptomyces eurocidicus]MBB5122385.1 DNA-binding transcriptional LysR family regulator [Streptomyces eurocidicus]MBF6051669.1 LysR family transcriptional regulator [Streptomyces eurocidicus]PNE30848.1 LysR family transcriptional regulator [Streptomyces eurocidicus]